MRIHDRIVCPLREDSIPRQEQSREKLQSARYRRYSNVLARTNIASTIAINLHMLQQKILESFYAILSAAVPSSSLWQIIDPRVKGQTAS